MHTIYYHEGYKAYYDGLSIFNNPYGYNPHGINSHEANEWKLGFMAAKANHK